jgi:hypothetical protein
MLSQLQASIFNTNFNPLRQRLGNKVLRQRLKGTALAEYYPPRIRVVQELRREYPEWEVDDDKEDIRLDGIQLRKIRGKGAPKKRRTKEGESLFADCTLFLLDRGEMLTGRRFETETKEETGRCTESIELAIAYA